MMSDEVENEVRSVFARTAADTIPGEAHRRLLNRDYHPRRVSRGLVVGGAVAAAAAIAVPLAIGAGSAAAPAIRLAASYTFQTPPGSRLIRAGSTACRAIPPPPLEVFNTAGSGRPGPSYTVAIKTAASSSGGCVSLQLEGAYRPTAASPDSDISLSHLQRYGQRPRHVQVGRFHGVIFTGAGPELFVQLPAGHGMMRDLAVAGHGLSRTELIRVVAHGLSS
jgi:hypothetical protein